jgi:hypothetical protein
MDTNRMIWAPVSALRAVFTGVGRIVMVADRPEAPPDQDANEARWRSLDLTGNVRLLSADDLDDGGMATARQAAPREPQGSPGRHSSPEPDASPEPHASPGPQTSLNPQAGPEPESRTDLNGEAVTLPLASYDSLTLPSIRARLRSLDADQLRELAAYERTHAERPDVLGMLERRIERLETGR